MLAVEISFLHNISVQTLHESDGKKRQSLIEQSNEAVQRSVL